MRPRTGRGWTPCCWSRRHISKMYTSSGRYPRDLLKSFWYYKCKRIRSHEVQSAIGYWVGRLMTISLNSSHRNVRSCESPMKASTGEYFNEIFTSKRSMRGYMVKLMNLSLNRSYGFVEKKYRWFCKFQGQTVLVSVIIWHGHFTEWLMVVSVSLLHGDVTENEVDIGALLLVRPMTVSLTIPHVNKLSWSPLSRAHAYFTE